MSSRKTLIKMLTVAIIVLGIIGSRRGHGSGDEGGDSEVGNDSAHGEHVWL
jgi:hypothetical protein